MLGLLDHDVLSSIELPFLPDLSDPSATPNPSTQSQPGKITKAQADQFDNSVFAVAPAVVEARTPSMTSRNSIVSQSTVGSYSKASDLKRSFSTRTVDSNRS